MTSDTALIADSFSILPELPSESFDLILTDPPYGVDYQSNRRVATEKFSKLKNDDGDLSWLPEFFRQCYRLLKPDRHAYIFCNYKCYPQFHAAMKHFSPSHECGGELKGGQSPKTPKHHLIIWDKITHGSGDLNYDYGPCHEFILFLSKGNRKWKLSRPNDIIRIQKLDGNSMVHPTEKPVKLLRKLIEYSTNPGELVLDPFAGSFSTARACKSRATSTGDTAHRNYFCIEIDPQYEPLIKSTEPSFL